MSNYEGRRGGIVATGTTGVLGAFALVVAATVQAGVAQATPMFNGTYTVVQKSSTTDPRTGERIEQPDQVSLWIVSSGCAIEGCIARAVKTGQGFDLIFDGKQWNRIGVAQTGTCGGATVPARTAALVLVPQSDGSLTGAVTSTVDCGGITVDSTLPLTAIRT